MMLRPLTDPLEPTMYLIPAAALSSDLLAAFESGSAHDATAEDLAALAVDSLDGAEGWLVDEDGDTHYRPAK